MRRFHAIIELDGPDMPQSRRIDAHLSAWSKRRARSKALELARAYAQEYKERGQTLSQYQLVYFEEMKGSLLRTGLLLLLALLAVGAVLAWVWPKSTGENISPRSVGGVRNQTTVQGAPR